MAIKHDIVAYVTAGVRNGDPNVIGIIVAVVVVFLSIVFFAIKRGRSNKRQGIILMGICDSGKTLLFTRLVYNTFKHTYTSMKANSGFMTLSEKKKNLRVVDIPGYDRLRVQMLDEYRDLARAIIFVVDSSTIQKEIKEVAEFLYTILTDKVISQIAPPVLVACNKHDLTLSKGANIIQSLLEKEMNTLRMTRSAALQGTDNVANNNTYLGKRNKDFEFADLKPLKVEFVECSARGKEDNSAGNLNAVLEWMARVA